MAYYHRFNPEAGFSGLLCPDAIPLSLSQNDLNLAWTTCIYLPSKPLISSTFDSASNNIQLQQHLSVSFLGQHKFIGGFDYLTGPRTSQRHNYTIISFPDLTSIPFLNTDYLTPQWSYSFYLLDYWRPFKNLVLELGLFKDFNNGVSPGFRQNVYTSLWSPRLGVNYQFKINDTQHVLRGVVGRCLNTHFLSTQQPPLVPAETAGFPWFFDSDSGTEIRQVGAAWEAQWNAQTFTVLRLNALRVSTPTFSNYFDDNYNVFEIPMWQTWKRYQASLVLNRILAGSLGLSAGILGKRVFTDLSYENSPKSYTEINGFIGLAYLHPKGWLARLQPLIVQQWGEVEGHKADNPFVILNLTLGREFPNKRGFALLEFQNLFNRRPFYSVEPVRTLEFANQRRFLFRLGFYF